MAATLNFDDLTPEQRSKLGVRKPRQSKFTQEDVRSYALRALAALTALTRDERDRVLKHAQKINRV
jgi:hypothetical protein